jgi:pseudouridine kinase
MRVSLLTAVGDDAAGDALLAHAAEQGIETGASLRLGGHSTGSYTALLDAGGELLLAMAAMDLCDAITPDYLLQCQDRLAQASLIVADLNLSEATLQAVIALALKNATPLVLVAVSALKMNRLPQDLHGTRLLILNRDELEALAGRSLPSLMDIGEACVLLRQRGVQDVVVTLGAQGAAYTQDSRLCHLPAPAIEVVDVTGAGDAFSAGLCWSLSLQPQDLNRACRVGIALAARTLQCETTVWAELKPATLLDMAIWPAGQEL